MENLQNLHLKSIDYDLKQFIINHLWNNKEAFIKKLNIKKNEYKFYWIDTKDIDFLIKYIDRLEVQRWLKTIIKIK